MPTFTSNAINNIKAIKNGGLLWVDLLRMDNMEYHD
mgnify:CR=1 FL=1